MSQHNHFVFWEDMWNESKEEDSKDKCCGNWDEFGKCNCKNKDNG